MARFVPKRDKYDIVAIVGTAPCYEEDLKRLNRLCKHDTICIGLVGKKVPCHIAYSVHGSQIDYKVPWNPQRVSSNIIKDGWKYGITMDWHGGSSALEAVKMAIEMGYRKIVMCGVPLDKTGNSIRGYGNSKTGDDYTRFLKAWEKRYDDIAPFVKSMSGQTMKLLGKPSRKWLK